MLWLFCSNLRICVILSQVLQKLFMKTTGSSRNERAGLSDVCLFSYVVPIELATATICDCSIERQQGKKISGEREDISESLNWTVSILQLKGVRIQMSILFCPFASIVNISLVYLSKPSNSLCLVAWLNSKYTRNQNLIL